MVKISNASYENQIQRVDSPFNEDFKNIIFLPREAIISGEGRTENLGKMAKNRETHCYQNERVVISDREYWPLLSGIKVFALLWFYYTAC